MIDGTEYTEQRMIIGTHTAEGEQNSLLITKVKLPKQDTEIDARKARLSDQRSFRRCL